MTRFLLRRSGQALLLLLVISVLAFVLLHAAKVLAGVGDESGDLIAPVGHELHDVGEILHDGPLVMAG